MQVSIVASYSDRTIMTTGSPVFRVMITGTRSSFTASINDPRFRRASV